jgi:hypothetical protein
MGSSLCLTRRGVAFLWPFQHAEERGHFKGSMLNEGCILVEA